MTMPPSAHAHGSFGVGGEGVRDSTVCGRQSLVDVRVGKDTVLHARTSERLKIGDDVRLTILPQRVLAYPAENP